MEGHQARVNLAMYLSLAGQHMNSFRGSSSLSQTEVCTASLTQTDTDLPDIVLTLFLTAYVGCSKLTFPTAPMTSSSGQQQTAKNSSMSRSCSNKREHPLRVLQLHLLFSTRKLKEGLML